MRKTTPTLATLLVLVLSGGAWAQAPAGGTSIEGVGRSPSGPARDGQSLGGDATGSTSRPLGRPVESPATNPALASPGSGPVGTGAPPGTGGTSGGPSIGNR